MNINNVIRIPIEEIVGEPVKAGEITVDKNGTVTVKTNYQATTIDGSEDWEYVFINGLKVFYTHKNYEFNNAAAIFDYDNAIDVGNNTSVSVAEVSDSYTDCYENELPVALLYYSNILSLLRFGRVEKINSEWSNINYFAYSKDVDPDTINIDDVKNHFQSHPFTFIFPTTQTRTFTGKIDPIVLKNSSSVLFSNGDLVVNYLTKNSNKDDEETKVEYNIDNGQGAYSLIANNLSENQAVGDYAYAEGTATLASGRASHSEGDSTVASADASHSEGFYTNASGYYSHVEGEYTIASQRNQHVFGKYNKSELGNGPSDAAALGTYVEIVGNGTGINNRSNARTLDWDGNEKLSGNLTLYSGKNNEIDVGQTLTDLSSIDVSGLQTTVSNVQTNLSNKADKNNTEIIGSFSLGRKRNTTVGLHSAVCGIECTASGDSSHAEGYYTTASGDYSHAEGRTSVAKFDAAHAEGGNTLAEGQYSHAEGYLSKAKGVNSHAEGADAIASGGQSHAEGNLTVASGSNSHAEGYKTTAKHRSQHVFGECNAIDSSNASGANRGTYVEIVGNGANESARSNARTLDWNGNEELTGNLKLYAGKNNEINVGQTLTSIANVDISSLQTTVNNMQVNQSVSNSVSVGANNEVNGDHSVAIGNGTYADADNTLAVGSGSSAGGNNSIAVGSGSNTVGVNSVAMGDNADAAGNNAISIGTYTRADNKDQIAIGSYNEPDPLSNNKANYNVKGQYIEIVGNGTSEVARSNARTLDWNGNETLAGDLKIKFGTSDEISVLQLAKAIKAYHGGIDDWSIFKEIVRLGKAEDYAPVGSQISDTWEKTAGGTTYDATWDVVHHGADGTYLEQHYATPDGVPFDEPEAIYYAVAGGLPAGTYHIDINVSYGNGWVAGQAIEFTLANAMDEGDQLVIDCGTYNANNPTNGRTWNVYAKGSTVSKEHGTTSNGTGGTSLGTISSTDTPSGQLNAISRVVYGYNRWSQSAMRQYLNSTAAAGSWWTPQNDWDRPPAVAATLRGWLAGCTEDFLKILEPVEVVTALNNYDSSGSVTTETTTDRIFLKSLQETYVTPQLADVEGEDWDYYKTLAQEAGLSGKFAQGGTYPVLISYRLDDHSSPVLVRLRSCGRNGAYTVWYVNSGGNVSGYSACYAYSGRPACKISKS